MSIEFSGLTDVGHKRDHNEDTFVCDEALGLYVLCDGMGGHAAGEVASDLAARTVHEVIGEQRALLDEVAKTDSPQGREKIAALIVEAVQTACRRVFETAQANPNQAGMGTTLEMILTVGHVGFMGHVGDSRLYTKRNGEVHQLSEDHSFVQEMVRAGMFTPEEAKHSPVNNVITRAVGIQETVKVDTLAFDILPGDTFLLCSDGLSDYLKDDAELASLLTEGPLEADARRLIELANDRGGKDNITTLLVRALPDDRPERRDTARGVGAKMDVLKQVRLFKHLTYKELVMLMNLTEVVRHPADVELISEGAHDTDFYVVLDGRLEVSQEGHILAKLGQGDHCGEMELVVPRSRSATVTTRTPVELLKIQRDEFIALLKKKEHLGMKLLWSFLQTLSVRLHHTNRKLSSALDDEEIAPPF